MSAAAVTRVSGAGQAPPTPDIWERPGAADTGLQGTIIWTHSCLDTQNSSAEGNQIYLIGCSGQTEQSYYSTLIVLV